MHAFIGTRAPRLQEVFVPRFFLISSLNGSSFTFCSLVYFLSKTIKWKKADERTKRVLKFSRESRQICTSFGTFLLIMRYSDCSHFFISHSDYWQGKQLSLKVDRQMLKTFAKSRRTTRTKRCCDAGNKWLENGLTS